MSLKENTAKIQSLLEKVNNLPEADSGNTSLPEVDDETTIQSIETCTVSIIYQDYPIKVIGATQYVDNQFKVYSYGSLSNSLTSTITIENVVCGSSLFLVTVEANNTVGMSNFKTEGINLEHRVFTGQTYPIGIFQVTADANTTATITTSNTLTT